MGLCSSAPPPDPSEVHAQLEAWCASIRLQFNSMPVLIVTEWECSVTIDGDVPSDIRDQFGIVKIVHTGSKYARDGSRIIRKKALWAIEANEKKSDEPLVTVAYLLSALVDGHGYKIVGQSTGGRNTQIRTIFALVKEK